MALKYIAVEGCTLSHGDGSPISGGTFTITSVASTKVKCENKGVYKTSLQYTFAGGNATGFTPGTVATTAPQSIDSTSISTKAEGSLVMRVEDTGTMSAVGTLTSPPPLPLPPTASIAGPVKISDAGQTKVQSN